jgi:hypothetical protein
MKKETKQKIGWLLLALIVGISYWLGLNYIATPMAKYGISIIYFGPIKTIKDGIYVEKFQVDGYKFSNGETKTTNLFVKCYNAFYRILTLFLIWFIINLLYLFVFYVLHIDIYRLFATGECKRKKMYFDVIQMFKYIWTGKNPPKADIDSDCTK